MKVQSKKRQVTGRSEKVAGAIATYLLRLQNGFAGYMAACTAGLSKKRLKIWLTIFCISFGGMSFFVFLGVFGNKNGAGENLKPTPLTYPRHYNQSQTQMLPTISHRDMEKIAQFKKYMDSLAISPSGRKVYDSILVVRPHLLDSVRLLETIYQSQLK